jgi:hypothetical protein
VYLPPLLLVPLQEAARPFLASLPPLFDFSSFPYFYSLSSALVPSSHHQRHTEPSVDALTSLPRSLPPSSFPFTTSSTCAQLSENGEERDEQAEEDVEVLLQSLGGLGSSRSSYERQEAKSLRWAKGRRLASAASTREEQGESRRRRRLVVEDDQEGEGRSEAFGTSTFLHFPPPLVSPGTVQKVGTQLRSREMLPTTEKEGRAACRRSVFSRTTSANGAGEGRRKMGKRVELATRLRLTVLKTTTRTRTGRSSSLPQKRCH